MNLIKTIIITIKTITGTNVKESSKMFRKSAFVLFQRTLEKVIVKKTNL